MQDDYLIVPSGSVDSYCRLCLSDICVEPLLVVTSDGSPQPNEKLVRLIKRYLEIELSAGSSEDCPSGICSTCRLMLEEFERFRERCLRCDHAITGKERAGMVNGGGGKELPFQCSECSIKFQFKADFEKHWKSVHDVPYGCEQCEARFSEMGMLEAHMFRYHVDGVAKDGVLNCPHCPRIFSDEKLLKIHEQVLHGPANFDIPAENGQPIGSGANEQVLLEPAVDPPAKKSKQDRSSTQKSSSNSSGRKPFECETCQAQFHFVGSLRHHVSSVHNSFLKVPRQKKSAPVLISKPPVVAAAPPRTTIVPEPTPEMIVPAMPDPVAASAYDQYSVPCEPVIIPDQLPLTKMEPLEPMPYRAGHQIPHYPGTYPLVIAVQRLDPNLVPPIPNYEIPLGKIYYAQQRLAAESISTVPIDDEEILMNYPSFAQKVSNQYICDICQRGFTQSSSMRRHKQTVHGVEHLPPPQPKQQSGPPIPATAPAPPNNDFLCVQCGKQCRNQNGLRRHMVQHTNQLPYPCDECPLQFTRLDNVTLHKEKSHYPGAPPQNLLFCPYCSRAFEKLGKMKGHISQIHREQYNQQQEAEAMMEQSTEEEQTQGQGGEGEADWSDFVFQTSQLENMHEQYSA